MSTNPYTPPPELLEGATRSLENSTARELRLAATGYEAYNARVGGKSAATGAPLPNWEQNPNNLVKAGWLASSQAVAAEVGKEVDAFCAELEAQRRKLVEATLADPRLALLLAPEWVATVSRLARSAVPEVSAMLVEAVLAAAVSLQRRADEREQELAELRLSVGATLNTLHERGTLEHEGQRCLEAAAMRMEAAGFRQSAEFLRLCARGEYSVAEPKAE